MSFYQYYILSARSFTNFRTKWLGLSIFIFYSMIIVLGRINLVLLSSTGVCQPYIINKNH